MIVIIDIRVQYDLQYIPTFKIDYRKVIEYLTVEL